MLVGIVLGDARKKGTAWAVPFEHLTDKSSNRASTPPKLEHGSRETGVRKSFKRESSLLVQHHVMADGITQHRASEYIGREVGL